MAKSKRQPAQEAPTEQATPQGLPLTPIPPERMMEPQAYLRRLGEIDTAMTEGKISAIDAQRLQEYTAKQYRQNTGRELSDHTQGLVSPLERLENETLLEKNGEDLRKLREAVQRVAGLSAEKKRRWLSMIDEVLRYQDLARRDPLYLWLYAGRDSETGEFFSAAPMHVGFFETWANPEGTWTLILAPPGHGKTTCFRWAVVWDICTNPNVRILRLCDSDRKAKKEIALTRQIIDSPHVQAVFPNIRVLSRHEKKEDSSWAFTVNRSNWQSREPTVEASAISSNYQGNGYDKIYADDIVTPECQHRASVREFLNFKWNSEAKKRLRNPRIAQVHVIGTPWHEEDIYGAEEKAAKEQPGRMLVRKFPVLDDENGDPIPIWPERYTVHYYKSERRTHLPSEWARLYQMKAMPEDDQIVPRLQYYPSVVTPEWDLLHDAKRQAWERRLRQINNCETWLSVDPSATSGAASSQTGAVKFALPPGEGRAYIVGIHQFPGDPVKMQDWIVEEIIAGRVHNLLIEAQGGMKGMVVLWRKYIEDELRKRGVDWKGSFVTPATTGGAGGSESSRQHVGKRVRLKSVAGLLANGYILFPGRVEWVKGIEQPQFLCANDDMAQTLTRQILNFPVGTSDLVDAVTQFVRHVRNRLEAETNERDDDRTIRQALRDQPDPNSLKSLKQQTLRDIDEVTRGDRNPFDEEYEWFSKHLSVA